MGISTSDTHLQRNNALVYFVEYRRVSSDLTDDAKAKHRRVPAVQPQNQIGKMAHSSWLVSLCYVQWLLPLLTFCDKHRQQNLTLHNKSTNEMRSENNKSTVSIRESTYPLL